MKILYFDCCMGAAGDMFMAALLELHPHPESFIERINALGIPGAEIIRESLTRHGVKGAHVKVLWNGMEEGPSDFTAMPEQRSPLNILALINSLHLKAETARNANAVLQLLFEAESHAHGGVPINDIHQSRLGTMDAIIDIVGACMLIEELAVDQIFASPIHVGSGHIHYRGGILPVPAPATEYILRGIPGYGGSVQGELCTPTGAALLKYFVTSFGVMPDIDIRSTGCGIGSKDFGIPGGLRAHFGFSVSNS